MGDTVLDRLAGLAGTRLEPGTDADTIGGIQPEVVARPDSPGAVAALMAAVDRAGLTAVVRGAGTKQGWANPPHACDVVVDVSALSGVLEFSPGDLVVRVAAGTPLAALQEAVRPAGLRLAVDEVVPGSTVGGVVATGLSGPTRYSLGAVRDLLIGITVVRADGVTARSGGKVVKNVAGYDLCKLYTGAYGTLGVVTEATFRLHPIPEASAFVRAAFADGATASAAIAAAVSSATVPSAVEVDRGPGGEVTVCARLDGTGTGVAGRAARLSGAFGPGAEVTGEAPSGWGTLPGPATIRVTAQIAGVGRLLDAIETVARAHGVPVTVRGSAGSGVLAAGFDPGCGPETAAALLADVRRECTAEGGFATLLEAPLSVRAAADAWGPVPGLSLMRQVKSSFDPGGRLAPGRFVGGI